VWFFEQRVRFINHNQQLEVLDRGVHRGTGADHDPNITRKDRKIALIPF
jgi:hypothetical protein